MNDWDRLSERMDQVRPDPSWCQSCGKTEGLTPWQECDNQDQPENIFVFLCAGCSDKLIEDHPRLYVERSETGEVLPGCMDVCSGCVHQSGTSCISPDSITRGGEGITFEPPPQIMHICRSPRSKSGWMTIQTEPVVRCSGKTTREERELSMTVHDPQSQTQKEQTPPPNPFFVPMPTGNSIRLNIPLSRTNRMELMVVNKMDPDEYNTMQKAIRMLKPEAEQTKKEAETDS